jgi:hypothetical protein
MQLLADETALDRFAIACKILFMIFIGYFIVEEALEIS